MKKNQIYCFSLFSASSELLEFPEQAGSTAISVGLEPVKLNGKLAEGDYLMPDGRTVIIEAGKIVKITPLSKQNISAMVKNLIKVRKPNF